jgi:hypothetical protein
VSTAIARDRGVAFVEARGDAFEVARAHALAAGRAPSELPLPAGSVQHADGSIGAAGSAAGAFDAELLLRVLGAAADLNALHLAVVERICAFLEASQRDDGSWGAGGASDVDRIVRTGMLAGQLGKTRFARAGVLMAAGDYIAERFTPDLVQDFQWPAIAAYTNYFATVPHDESDAVLQWTGRELERGFRAGRFDGVRTARVLLYAEAPSLPGGKVDAAEAIERLLGEQQPDGGWLRFDDPTESSRIEHTLDALTALVRFG